MKLLRSLMWVSMVSLAVPQLALAKPDVAKLAQSRVDAAAKLHAKAVIVYRSGTVEQDVVYLWSVRWLAATIETTGKAEPALTDHLKRMQDLEQEVTAHFKAGLTSSLALDAATYERVEAELWQARGKMN